MLLYYIQSYPLGPKESYNRLSLTINIRSIPAKKTATLARLWNNFEAFFREEPYRSMRDRFDVYSVTAVSKNGEVSVNSSHYGGTCYMYSDNSSISFTPIISFDDELFAQCVSHETAGHGFGKLKDEYDYGKPITEEAKAEFLEQKGWGWAANVDIVGTASQIQWSFMLNDSRYKDYVGIYEGALSNAPSRFAIYKRIIEWSEGRTPSFEEFATFDAKNLTKSPARMMSAPRKTSDEFVPFAAPVVIKGSWRD